MAALKQLESLNDFVSKFLQDETYGIVLSDKAYQKELDEVFDSSTRTIRSDIEEYVQDLILKEDCDLTIDDFRYNLSQVQEKMNELNAVSEKTMESIADNDSLSTRQKVQLSFCFKLMSFLRDLIGRVEEWREGTLSAQEANEQNYFMDLRIDKDQLPLVYHNLVNKGWIVKSKTSLNNFIYYFTGKGFRPQNPIRWNSTEPILTLLLENMTIDEKRWAKAALIFEKRKRGTGEYHPVNREQLSVSRNKVLNNDDLRWLLREVMFGVLGFRDWEQRAKDYHLLKNG